MHESPWPFCIVVRPKDLLIRIVFHYQVIRHTGRMLRWPVATVFPKVKSARTACQSLLTTSKMTARDNYHSFLCHPRVIWLSSNRQMTESEFCWRIFSGFSWEHRSLAVDLGDFYNSTAQHLSNSEWFRLVFCIFSLPSFVFCLFYAWCTCLNMFWKQKSYSNLEKSSISCCSFFSFESSLDF